MSAPEPTAPPPDPADSGKTQRSLLDREEVLDQIGGIRGLIDSGLPIIVFITVNSFTSLQVALWSSIAVAVVIFGLRLARKEKVQQAISGLLGVGVAALIAGATGEARNFFLPQLWSTALFTVACFGSILLRWPLIGLIAEFLFPTTALRDDPKAWRRTRRFLRTYTWLTVLWGAVYLARMLVQGWFYLQDQVELLGTARLIMGWPLTAVEVLITVAVITRLRRSPAVRGDTDTDATDADDAEGPAVDAEGAASPAAPRSTADDPADPESPQR